MPEIRPFRALRYDPAAVGDVSCVVAPPYDVISPAQHQVLLLRDPRNIVRLDLPAEEPTDAPGDKYRRAARTLAAWRSDGTLRKDQRSSIYVYEQSYQVPGTGEQRTQRGFFARLRLEPYGPGSGVLPHERTLPAAREDRYLLLRATGVNTSPVVGLYDTTVGVDATLRALTSAPPAIDVADDDATRHRLWVVPAGDAETPDERVASLLAAVRAGPVFIADGHHRYDTALRYRDERRMTRSCEEDPAFDYLLMLLLDSGQPLTVLPTHRVVRGLEAAGGGLLERARELFEVQPATREALVTEFEAAALQPGGRGRFGLWTRDGGALLTARADAFDAILPSGASPALRELDAARIGVALDRLAGIDADAVASGRVGYTKSVEEALDSVDRNVDGADAAMLLEPTPVGAIQAVARSGEVMPQKSTYFFPKALSGLLINPLEW